MRQTVVLILLLLLSSCKSEKDGKQNESIAQELPAQVQQSISRGAELYNSFCASCHLPSGEGIAGTFPPLKGSEWLKEKRLASIHAVKFGLDGPIEVKGEAYDNLMPDLGLTDAEIADILNYIGYSWGNQLERPFSENEISQVQE